jgi:N,N'-diacetyllegionaminate synthase
MNTLKTAFGLDVGYSDHTLGIEMTVAAAVLGASIIEKHFTLDRNMVGPDHKASLEPYELEYMVQCIRHVESGLGDGIKNISYDEIYNRQIIRKSIIAFRNIKKGEKIKRDMISVKRPGYGISPSMLSDVIGKIALEDIHENDFITWDMIGC